MSNFVILYAKTIKNIINVLNYVQIVGNFSHIKKFSKKLFIVIYNYVRKHLESVDHGRKIRFIRLRDF